MKIIFVQGRMSYEVTYLGETLIGMIINAPSQAYDVSYTDSQSGKIINLVHLSIHRTAGVGHVSDYFSGGLWRQQFGANFTRVANYLAK